MSKRMQLSVLSYIVMFFLILSCGRKKQGDDKDIAVIGGDTITMEDIRRIGIDTSSPGFIHKSLLSIYLTENRSDSSEEKQKKLSEELSKQLALRTGKKMSSEKADGLLLTAAKLSRLCKKYGSREKAIVHLDSLLSTIELLPHDTVLKENVLFADGDDQDSAGSSEDINHGECVKTILEEKFSLSPEVSGLITDFLSADGSESSFLDSTEMKSLVSDLLFDEEDIKKKQIKKNVRRKRPDAKLALRYRPQESIRDTIMKHIPNLKALYKKNLKIFPDMSGKIYITFSVSADGSVKSVRIKSSDITRKEFLDQLLAQLKTINYKKIPGNIGTMTFDFPFEFTPEG